MNTSIIKVRIFCRSQKFAAGGIFPFRPPLNASLLVSVVDYGTVVRVTVTTSVENHLDKFI
jgi:hypothetical protein